MTKERIIEELRATAQLLNYCTIGLEDDFCNNNMSRQNEEDIVAAFSSIVEKLHYIIHEAETEGEEHE